MSSVSPRYLIFLACLLSAPQLNAQLQVFSIDASAFPEVRATFFGVDASGEKIIPRPQDVPVSEHGVPCPVTDVLMPPAPPLPALSITIGIVTDKGMYLLPNNGGPTLDLQKSGARQLVDILAGDSVEIAVTSYEERAYLRQPFTRNRAAVYAAIDRIPQAVANYPRTARQWFLDSGAGLLNVARQGTGRRAVFLFTNGYEDPLFQGDNKEVQALLDISRQYGISIHIARCGMPRTNHRGQSDLAVYSGGGLLGEALTKGSLTKWLFDWFYRVRGDKPCTLVWRNAGDCGMKSVSAEIRFPGVRDTFRFTYGLTPEVTASVAIEPGVLSYGVVAAGVRNVRSVKITARRHTTIFDIESNRNIFRVLDTSLRYPFVMEAGDSIVLDVACTPEDTVFVRGSLRVRTDGCDNTIALYAGTPLVQPPGPALRFVAPNSSDTLRAGDSIDIAWQSRDGAPVYVFASLDADSTWMPWMPDATTGPVRWRVPYAPNGVRFSIYDPRADAASVALEPVIKDPAARVEWSRDGGFYWISAENDDYMICERRSYPSGALLNSFYFNKLYGPVVLDADRSCPRLIAVQGRKAMVVDAKSGRQSDTWLAESVTRVQLHPQGSIAALLTVNARVHIWDTDSLCYITRLAGMRYQDSVISLQWSPVGLVLAIEVRRPSEGDTVIAVINANTGTVHSVVPAHGTVAWSSNGQFLSVLHSGTLSVWNAGTGIECMPEQTLENITAAGWSSDGARLAITTRDSSLYILEAENRAVRRLPLPSGQATAAPAWAPDGSAIAQGFGDGTVGIIDAVSGAERMRCKLLRAAVSYVQWHPDAGRVLALSIPYAEPGRNDTGRILANWNLRLYEGNNIARSARFVVINSGTGSSSDIDSVSEEEIHENKPGNVPPRIELVCSRITHDVLLRCALQGPSDVRLYDVRGSELWRTEMPDGQGTTTDTPLPTRSLARGTYFAVVRCNGSLHTLPFIVAGD